MAGYNVDIQHAHCGIVSWYRSGQHRLQLGYNISWSEGSLLSLYSREGPALVRAKQNVYLETREAISVVGEVRVSQMVELILAERYPLIRNRLTNEGDCEYSSSRLLRPYLSCTLTQTCLQARARLPFEPK